MTQGRSYTFTHAIARAPGSSVAGGLRAEDRGGDPDAAAFQSEHDAYVAALRAAGAQVTVLDPLEEFPDSVFVEDAALCLAGKAIALRPGAPSRFGETAAIRPALKAALGEVLDLPGDGFVDGGDILVSDDEAFVGLSARTDEAGYEALKSVLADLGYGIRKVHTPAEILHFKTDCGLLDSETIFATRALAATGCFEGYRVIEAPEGEEAAANLIRFNDAVFISSGYPRARDLLTDKGYKVVELSTHEAARVDGGLSCMSLRFTPVR